MPNHTDSRGHQLSTNNAAAVAACNAGIEGYNTWRADAMGHLDEAIATDQDFALPKVAKAWILHMGRSATFAAKIRDLIDDAKACVDNTNDRERALLTALEAAAAGRGIEAATTMEALLGRYPTGLFAHRLVQFELFWNGRAECMLDIVERAAPHWSDSIDGYGDFLSCRAFSNEETGRYAQAEGFGRQAIEINDSDAWGTHAVAHVLVMQGRIDDGVNWLEGLSGNWGTANQIKHHLWWHLSLFLLERGEHERILQLLTSQIRPPDSPLVQAIPDATIDLQNVASILQRLELRGVDVGDHWAVLADICASRVDNQANAFSNAHDMMVLAATGQFDKAEELLRSINDFVQQGDGNLVNSYRCAGTAVCAAVLAHRRGEYDKVIDALLPVRHDLSLIGGSHAQRDLFYQLLVNAAHREGRSDLVSLLLNDVRRIGFERVEERTLYRDIALAA